MSAERTRDEASQGGIFERARALVAKLAEKPRPPVGTTPADVVFAENKWRLLRYRRPGSLAPGKTRKATPVLLVPSLINRHYVLDLLPGRSFAEWMVGEGHDVFILDWGTPGDEDRYLGFDTVVDTYLGRALRRATEAAGASSAHVLGYCLGGTLATIHTALRPARVRSLTLLAAPIAFHDGGMLSLWTRTKSFDVRALVEGAGNVPWPLMQSAFHMLRPTLSAQKTVQLLDRAWDDEFLDGFLAIEAWGNDNVSFPGACYEKYIEELYRGDALMAGTLSVSGLPVRLESITCPLLTIAFQHDTIVPTESATAVMDRVGSTDKHLRVLGGGHVGAVVSKKAAASLWPAISTFWADRDAGP
jgi:polyhydroxyalkanoate synthase